MAQLYVDAGARWIHFVDLDFAVDARTANLELLERIARLPVNVQVGGGLDAEGVRSALERGATRAILGAAALRDMPTVAEVLERHGGRVGVGLDVHGGVIEPRGTNRAGPALDSVVPELARLGPAFVVYANVPRDGALAGPNVEGVAGVAAALGLPVVASGGVRSVQDLVALAGIAGVAGAIVGRALLEGAFTLDQALAAVA